MSRARRRQALVWMLTLGWVIAAGADPLQAASDDGRWQVTGEGAWLVVRDGGQVVKILPARSLAGGESAHVAAVRHLPLRRSFLIGFAPGLPELWELSVDPAAPPQYAGMVHDFRLGEGLASPGFLGVRRTRLSAAWRALASDGSQAYVLLRMQDDPPAGGARLVLMQLDVRREIARWDVNADPDLDAALALERDGRPLIELRDRQGGPTITIDPRAAALRYGDW